LPRPALSEPFNGGRTEPERNGLNPVACAWSGDAGVDDDDDAAAENPPPLLNEFI
jgi:hypothetical protein